MNVFRSTSVVAIIWLVCMLSAKAEQICVHGNSGHFQNPDRAISRLWNRTTNTRVGWGLDIRIPREFTTRDVSYAWIHYSIPVTNDLTYGTLIVQILGGQRWSDPRDLSLGWCCY